MKLAKPQFVRTGLEPISVAQLADEASFGQVNFSNGDAAGLHARNMRFDEAVLERVLLIEARLEKLSLADVELKACDLSAARCSESSLIRVHFVGGRMTGIDLSRSTLKDIVFENCKLDMANFRFAKLTRVEFINCALSETDFQAAEFSEVVFRDCHLEKAEFGQCKIKRVDARSSQLYDIRGWQSLKGLTIGTTQLMTIAPQLALELGLIVKE